MATQSRRVFRKHSPHRSKYIWFNLPPQYSTDLVLAPPCESLALTCASLPSQINRFGFGNELPDLRHTQLLAGRRGRSLRRSLRISRISNCDKGLRLLRVRIITARLSAPRGPGRYRDSNAGVLLHPASAPLVVAVNQELHHRVLTVVNQALCPALERRLPLQLSYMSHL